ncbi:MAG: DUF4139 domain-containing protein [Bacteroidia bacterium]|jgi:uncharacterized protein (TIGR02231 family)
METSRYNNALRKLMAPACPSISKFRHIMLAAFFMATVPQAWSGNEIKVNSTIKAVTVYLNKAQVTRIANVSVNRGTSQLIFENLSPQLDFNSIQVRGDQNLTLLSVNQRNNYLKASVKTPEIIALEDSLETTSDMITAIKIKREALQIEKDLLQANKVLFGANNGLHIDDLEDALLLYRKRTQEIGEEQHRLIKAEKPLVLIHEILKRQLQIIQRRQQNPVELVVTVECDKALDNALVEITYLVSQVSWSIFYDIRVKDTHSPLQLISKAHITQQTGEDWSDVNLILSTLTPNESGNKPELEPLRIDFLNNAVVIQRKQMKEGKIQQLNAVQDHVPAMAAPPVQVMETEIQIEFHIANPYTILSDGNPQTVDLNTTSIQATYGHAVVPKYNTSVYTTASIPASGLINLLPGNANVYLSGAFTGTTYISNTASDTMVISLGIDKRIHVERILMAEISSRTCCFGGNKKDVNGWEIRLRNTRKETVQLMVEDQIPVTKNSEIEVTLLEKSGAQFEESTGKLTWYITLEPEQSLKIPFSFEVKYPKNKQITPF